jgi:hypothetical protein
MEEAPDRVISETGGIPQSLAAVRLWLARFVTGMQKVSAGLRFFARHRMPELPRAQSVLVAIFGPES